MSVDKFYLTSCEIMRRASQCSIGLAKTFIQVFHTVLWKNPNNLFGQAYICHRSWSVSSGLSRSPLFCWGLCKRFWFSPNEIDCGSDSDTQDYCQFSFCSPSPCYGSHKTQWRWGNSFFRKADSPKRVSTGTSDPQKWENLRPDGVLAGIIKVNR